MISCTELQKAYVDMYKEFMNYIWSYPTVVALADLEVSVYQTCPNIEVVRKNFYTLNNLVRYVTFEDDDLKKAMTSFSDKMNESEDIYCKLVSVNEVDYENIEENTNQM